MRFHLVLVRMLCCVGLVHRAQYWGGEERHGHGQGPKREERLEKRKELLEIDLQGNRE